MKSRGRLRRTPFAVLVLAWAVMPRVALVGITPPKAEGYIRVPGGHLAYEVLGGPLRAADETPIVMVHGGPGVATRSGDRFALRAVAEHRSVVLYDQIGAGASTRLNDPADYTFDRAVADLEELRSELALRRMVLLGHSWGAVVAAHYAVRHSTAVERLVLVAPGSAELDARVQDDPALRLTPTERIELYGHLLHPRSAAMYVLTVADPSVGHYIAGDREMDRRFAAILAATAPGLFCDTSLASTYPVDGVGYYAHHAPQVDQERIPLHRPERRIRTLVVKPECDYLPWSTTHRYIEVFGAQVVLLPDAGHAAHMERPAAFTDVLMGFLAGDQLEHEIHPPFAPPSTFEGPL